MENLEFDVLVNKEHSIDINYKPKCLIRLDNNENNFHNFFDPNEKPRISLQIYIPFKKMEIGSLKDGLHIMVGSGYRSSDYQQRLFNDVFAQKLSLLKEQYPNLSDTKLYFDAFEMACVRIAKPGHSEHQTGYAIDIECIRDDMFVGPTEEEYKWMNENAYKYGFILRYPQGKEDITQFDYEPWHYRYVGEDIAKLLYNNGDWLTLEEYHKELKLKR